MGQLGPAVASGSGSDSTRSRSSLDYTVENVGGVERLELHFAGPAVYVLRGANGVGKTSALRGLARAHGADVPIEKRDGSEKGRVTGPGVKLLITGTRKHNTIDEAEVELAEVGPLSRLIDPQIKDSDKAAAHRIKGLVELLDLGVDDEHLRALCGGDAELMEWLVRHCDDEEIDDLMTASDRLRRKLNADALEQEKAEGAAKGRVAATVERIGELALEVPTAKLANLVDTETVADAQKSHEEAIRRHDKALAKCEARESLEKAQREVRATIGEQANVAVVEERCDDARTRLQNTRQSIASLQNEFRDLEAAAHVIEAELEMAERALTDAKADAVRWERQQAILEQAVEGPTREDVERMKRDVVDASLERLAIARLAEDYRGERERQEEAELESAEAGERARSLRGRAAAIPSLLGEILAAAGASGLTVVDGRLHAIRDGELHDFETRCSTGQRVKAALEVAAMAYRGKVLPLSAEIWGSLDPAAKRDFAETVRRLGLYVITEQADDGELRVEEV